MARKPPATRFPDAVAVTYYRDVKALLNDLRDVVIRIFDNDIREQVKAYRNRVDSSDLIEDGALDIIRQAIETMKALSLGIFTADSMQNIASKFVHGVERFNKENIRQQGRIIGIDPTQNEPWLDEFMRTSIAENVSYIKRYSDEFFPQIETIIYQGTKKGTSEAVMKRELMAKVGMSEKKARFIARDQTGSILGQLTAERHKAMGVSRFVWITSKDEKVRPTHKAHEGQIYEYSNPPKEGLPGEDYFCRCTATPVFDD